MVVGVDKACCQGAAERMSRDYPMADFAVLRH
jgi:hypothetical protein